MPSIRVLHIITNLEVGGAETMLYKLLSHASAPDVTHEVISLIGLGSFGARIEQLGVRCRCLGFGGFQGTTRGLRQLFRIIKEEQPDVIHAWLIHSAVAASLCSMLIGLLSSKKPRIPVLWGMRNSIRALEDESVLTRICLGLGILLSHHPRTIIFNSEQGKRDYERLRFCTKSSTIIPNGFDTHNSTPIAELTPDQQSSLKDTDGRLRIGTCARFHPMKGHLLLIQAAAIVIKQFPTALFILAGSKITGQNKLIMDEIEKLGLEKHFSLLDEVKDVRALAPFLDLHVLPSAWGEGFPNILGEMMLAGVPCIATDVGASREILGHNGAIVPPGDSYALAQAIIASLKLSKEERKRIGALGQSRIQAHFSLDEVVASYENLYQQVS